MRTLRTRRDGATDHLVAFAAYASRRRWPAARAALARARRAGATRAAAEETALMLVLHAGYPAALEGARLLAEHWPGRPRGREQGGPRVWRRRGEALCRRVYGAAYEPLMHSVRALQPDLATWMVEEGYGRVLSRGGLDERARELVAVAVLAAGAWERQLVSHLLGAARLGAAPGAVAGAVAAGVRAGGPEARAAARRAVDRARRAGANAG